MNLHFTKTHSHYVVYNVDKSHAHTHIRKVSTAVLLINLLKRGILPISPYLQESARRLLTTEEFLSLKESKKKDKYINVQKGVIS